MGTTTAPTNTTKLYDGVGVQSTEDASVFVMKGGDAGGTHSVGGLPRFMATNSNASNMPPGITASRRIVGCVCFAPRTTATLYGTHTAPTGWTVVYKGYVMTNNHATIIVDTDSFDSSGTSTTGADLDFTTLRFSQTFDTTNYPTNKHIKGCVVMKN